MSEYIPNTIVLVLKSLTGSDSSLFLGVRWRQIDKLPFHARERIAYVPVTALLFSSKVLRWDVMRKLSDESGHSASKVKESS